MSLYFKKLAGEWCVYGPADEIQLGEVEVRRQNGRVTTATIERIGKDVRIGGDRVRLGHIAQRGSTYRERREAKADRLEGWAEKRQEDAVAALNSHPELRSDWAFITQPGRIPARDRMNAADERAFRSMDKAERMAERADGIRAQNAGAIYSDDPDAIEQLEAKIAKLEAQREDMKARNAAYRKEHRAELKEMTAYGRNQAVPYPSYAITNLTGNLARYRDRLDRLKREKALLS